MIHVKGIIFILMMLIMISCDSLTDDNEGEYVVRGTLSVEGKPLSGANVQIDDVLNWKTSSDSLGYFIISGVTKGDHLLKALKTNENDSSYISLKSPIYLNSEVTDLGEIKLPIPPTMYQVSCSNVFLDSVYLKWSQATDSEFREYKLYRLDNPGLDETTGDLIYVSTYRSDTVFVDKNLQPATRYYYRVYILSSFGKMGGSNLINILVPQNNLIKNPDFEISTDGLRPDIWKESAWYCPPTGGYVTNIFMDSINVYSGIYSGKIFYDPNYLPQPWETGEIEICQRIEKEDFEVDAKYELSMWIKTGNIRVQANIGRLGYWWGPLLPATWIEKNTDWTKYSVTFTPHSDDLSEDSFFRIFIDWGTADNPGYAWIDEIKLVKVVND
ncbi:MAG TPA: hypothetical protein PL107_09995 [Candidatus Marinimicrobia bacterium]|nr:hypothetical protein [Bacteroidales bacterium]HOV24578.1 hypothetical protein [Candidatus Neomarinimicrobiota bacterium]